MGFAVQDVDDSWLRTVRDCFQSGPSRCGRAVDRRRAGIRKTKARNRKNISVGGDRGGASLFRIQRADWKDRRYGVGLRNGMMSAVLSNVRRVGLSTARPWRIDFRHAL